MVSKLISPIVTQSNEDRDTVKMLRNMNAHLKKKMDELSFAFHKSTQRGGNIEELWRKSATMDNERKALDSRLSQ
jgi:hypothetical protein